MRRLSYIVLAVMVIGVTLFSYARWIEPDRIVVDEVTLEIPDLDPALESLTVVLIADLHIDAAGRREERLVRTVNELQPDLLLVAGDFVQNAYWMSDYLVYVAEACSVLAGIRPRYGTIGIFGNNDEPEVMVKPLADVGIRTLENETVDLDLGGAGLRVGGLGDPVTDRDDWDRLLASPVPQILLAHSPDAFHRAAAAGIPVVLAGHTHGGQVLHPFIWLDPVRFLRVKPGTPVYRAGTYEHESSTLYVNRGIGCTHMRLRFLCPPEVTVVNLVRKR